MKLFISYRRQDSLARVFADRLLENLTAGKRHSVFVDTHDHGATDYVVRITGEIIAADFMLVLIGPEWLKLLKDRAKTGAEDWVRYEIELALAHGIDLVPIFLDGVEMPKGTELPPSIAKLTVASGFPLSTGPTYHTQLDIITRSLDARCARRRSWRRSAWMLFARRSPTRRGTSDPVAPPIAPPLASAPGPAASGSSTPAVMPLRPAPSRPAPAECRPLNIVIVMSTGVPYERELIEGLKARLAEAFPSRGLTLKILSEKVGPVKQEAETQEEREVRWQSLFEHLALTVGPGTVDYVVSVATFASTMVKKHRLVRALGAKGQIYMGTTSPPKSGLTDQPGIAGVQYGAGGREYALMFDEMFPRTQKLVFLYNDYAEHDQDRGYAAEIEKLNDELRGEHGGKDRFELRPLKRNMTIADLKEIDPANPGENEVYMAWYDLDDLVSRLSHSGDAALARSSAWVVPSTYTMENINLFGAIVGVDDSVGGRTAADILLLLVDNPDLKPEDIPMGTHGFRVTLKPPVIVRRKLPIREEAFYRQQDPRYRYERA